MCYFQLLMPYGITWWSQWVGNRSIGIKLSQGSYVQLRNILTYSHPATVFEPETESTLTLVQFLWLTINYWDKAKGYESSYWKQMICLSPQLPPNWRRRLEKCWRVRYKKQECFLFLMIYQSLSIIIIYVTIIISIL